MKIMRFDKPTCRLFHEAILAVSKKVAEDFGVSLAYKGGTFNEHSFTLKLEAACIGKDGVIHNKEAEAFKMFASQFDLSPDDFGKVFVDYTGNAYSITGLSTRSWKAPILAKCMRSGKTYKFPSLQVKDALKRG